MNNECLIKIKRQGKTAKKFSIPMTATYKDLDDKICDKFGYDTWDHCRAFFLGSAWSDLQLASIMPDGSGENERVNISQLLAADKITYIYDFGAEIQHDIKIVH